jgi:Mlc titration factor MtfA (ptsG expression regulator)
MYIETLWPIYLAALAMIIYLIVEKVRLARNTTRVRRFDFPKRWMPILEKNVPLYRKMPLNLQEHHQQLVMQFIEDKTFEACGGLSDITDEMKVTIAGNAVIPVLGRYSDMYRKVRTVLIYPSAFFNSKKKEDGVRLGEAWPNGTVILSWDATKHSARDVRDGFNVAIHEFAHQLDMDDGSANGVPTLDHGALYGPWAEVLSSEFAKLQATAAKGKKTVLDDYGATNPAEFFAVATETFFEKARTMERNHPELYERMRSYYRVDPARWNRLKKREPSVA